jgi:hypothetical protein
MSRLVSLAAAAAASLTLLSATSGYAAPRGYYVATATQAPEKANFVTRNTAWSCNGAVCTAAKAPERDAFVCERVAGEVGALSAFAVAGAAFDAEALARCNKKAK